MSNVERQRRFRQRNPGYFAKYRQSAKAFRESRQYENAMANARAAAEAMLAEKASQNAAAASAPKVQLALPAPAVVPELPGINTIAAKPDAEPQVVLEWAAA